MADNESATHSPAAAEEDEVSLLKIPEYLNSAPVNALSTSAHRGLAMHLNNRRLVMTREGLATDWEGLAQLCGFEILYIGNLRSLESPTERVLMDWMTQPNATVGALIGFLRQMERWDILEDECLVKSFVNDIQLFNEREKLKKSAPDSKSNTEALDWSQVKDVALTRSQAQTGVADHFDAFMSCAEEDLAMVLQMVNVLETNYHFKLCLCSRDLLPSTYQYDAMAKLMKDRCRKVIIVLTPEYLRSPECEFQLQFALALSITSRTKRLIPAIMRGPIQVPDVLRPIAALDYTKRDMVQFFWHRLQASLQDFSSAPPTDLAPMRRGQYVVRSIDWSILPQVQQVPCLPGPPESPPIEPRDTYNSIAIPTNSKPTCVCDEHDESTQPSQVQHQTTEQSPVPSPPPIRRSFFYKLKKCMFKNKP